MKNVKFFTILFVLFCIIRTEAQECGLPLSSIDIQGNNIKAKILNGGDLFTDLANGQFIPNPNGTNSPSTIFSAGLWMGGVSASGDLSLATVDYRSSERGDYSAGPLDTNGVTAASTCSNWDRMFRVTGSEIAAFKAALPLTQAQAIAQFPSIMQWPGDYNPHFSDITGFDLPSNPSGLAPFFDKDSNGNYNPLDGDYPVVRLNGHAPFVPAEIVWCVFNDQKGGAPHTSSGGRAFNTEIQLTVWAMQSTTHPVLNNTVFTSHKTIYRGTDTLNSNYIGLWVDLDLGCYADDYIGCNPELNSFFVYNQDSQDGQPGNSCFGDPTFAGIPPVQSVTFLGQSMDKFMYMGGITPGLADPTTGAQFYNFMTGAWGDGTPLTEGGSGYGGTTTVDYAFPDDPSNQNGWNMCTANLAPEDRKVLATHSIGELQPGQTVEFNAAWTTHFVTESPCSVGNTFDEIETLIDIYEGGFSTVSKVADLAPLSFELLPNPTSNQVTCRYGDTKINEIRVFNAGGNLVGSIQNPEVAQTTLDVSRYPVGIYTIQLIGKDAIGVQKVSVLR